MHLEDFSATLNLRKSNESYYGHYLQYWFELNQIEKNIISLSMVVDESFSFEPLKESLLEMDCITDIEVHENLLEATINMEALKNINTIEFFNEFFAICKKSGVKPICKLCQINLPNAYFKHDNKIFPSCNECVDDANRLKKAIQSPDLRTYMRGSIGALFGALLGSVVWVIIALIGFFAAIGGVAISYAAYMGYTKLGGISNKKSIIIIGLSILVAVVFAEFVCIAIELYRHFSADGIEVGLLNIILITFYILGDSEVFGEFIRNILLGLLFAGLGSWGLLKDILENAKATNALIEEI